MDNLWPRIERILPFVQTPGQYVGCELNAIVKDPDSTKLSVCLAFPDTYAVGMSHLGIKIIYDVLNALPQVACERVFAPWPDMGRMLKENGLPLFSLESKCPVRDFDVVGFSLQYELCCSTVLYMLELAGVPIRSEDRGESDPIVIAGGPGAFNPEVMADFFDAFLIGEAEESVVDFVQLIDRLKREDGGISREELLRRLALEVPGTYVPSLYGADGGGMPRPKGEAPGTIVRRVVEDLDSAPFPTRPVVPFVEVVHDRIAIEIMRGCTNGCRFCQAGMTCLPQRERSVEKIIELAEESYRNTGLDEIGLLSLSTSDYSAIRELVRRLAAKFDPLSVSLSLPSLRVCSILADLPQGVSSVRKSGLTIAPECAGDRLRKSINKPIDNSELVEGVLEAFHSGWKSVKLYFMIGLPGETDDDVRAIASLAGEIIRSHPRSGSRRGNLNLSISSFIPKPHTPFQWEAMCPAEELRRKQKLIRDSIRSRRIRYKFHDVETSVLEGVFSRGDRRLCKAVSRARELGAVFDSWSEHFKAEVWRQAFEETGVDTAEYLGPRDTAGELPWDHVAVGVSKEFLLQERQRSKEDLVG